MPDNKENRVNRNPNDKPNKPHVWVLIPCAGTGSRAGTALPKQYVRLNGKPVVAYTLEAMLAVKGIAGVLVVVPKEENSATLDMLPLFDKYCPQYKHLAVAAGGKTRAQSVRGGLSALSAQGAKPNDWVLVHDAARCLIKPEWVQSLIDDCMDDEVGGLLAQPVPDTLKRSHGNRSVQSISRENIWLAQTPQMFRLGLLEQALDEAQLKGLEVTDEASAIEAMGLLPKLVACSAENFKLTYPDDFQRAEAVLKARISKQ